MFLKNLWYFAQRGDRLKRGSMVAKTLLGEPVLIVRDADGNPFALPAGTFTDSVLVSSTLPRP